MPTSTEDRRTVDTPYEYSGCPVFVPHTDAWTAGPMRGFLMSLVRNTRVLFLLTLATLTACGSSVVDPKAPEPAALDVPFSLVVDVRDNLLRHYRYAAKPYTPESVVHFDFRETARTIDAQRATIVGEFLFSLNGGPLQQGRITVLFVVHNGNWTRTGEFYVDEVPVEAHTLSLQARDSVTSKPLAGVQVEARRTADGIRSSAVRSTDAAGLVSLQVLMGEFQIRASREGYRPALSDYIVVAAGATAPAQIRLVPAGAVLQL